MKQPARIVAAPAALPPGAPNQPAELTFADLDAAAAAFGLSADEAAKALHWGYAVQHPETRTVCYLAFAKVEGAEYGRWAAVVLVRPFSSVMLCPPRRRRRPARACHVPHVCCAARPGARGTAACSAAPLPAHAGCCLCTHAGRRAHWRGLALRLTSALRQAGLFGLEVSYRGRLRQWMGDHHQEIRPGRHGGYNVVWCKSLPGGHVKVRDLVAAAFVPKPATDAALVLCNRDGDTTNDAAANLVWRRQ